MDIKLLLYVHVLFNIFGWGQTVKNEKILINPEIGHFVDSKGRVIMFRGMNAVHKGFPWYPSYLLNKDIHQFIADMGFNVVRLGAMWSGVQPSGENSHNQTYIGIIKDMVASLGEKGVHSILDLHQDNLWNLYYGIPEWVKHKAPPSSHPYPSPMHHITLDKWACGYFTQDTSQGFQSIYDNTNGIGDDFVHYWGLIASEFKGLSNVLGYDIMNEPWVGNLYKDTSFLLPGIGGEKNIAPLMERAAKEIWSVQDDAVVFFEGATWGTAFPIEKNSVVDNLLYNIFKNIDFKFIMKIIKPICDESHRFEKGSLQKIFEHVKVAFFKLSKNYQSIDTSVLGTGFKTVPGGDNYRNRTALSWHHYCHVAKMGAETTWLHKILCFQIVGPAAFKSVKIQQKALGGTATILSEFGLCRPDLKRPNLMDTTACNYVMTKAEEDFVSWTYWDTASSLHMFIDPEGAFKLDTIKFFARPYPEATNGIPEYLKYDPFTGEFLFRFTPKESMIDLPTEILIPKFAYENYKYKVDHSDDITFTTKDNDKSRLYVHLKSNEGPLRTSEIRIRPLNE